VSPSSPILQLFLFFSFFVFCIISSLFFSLTETPSSILPPSCVYVKCRDVRCSPLELGDETRLPPVVVGGADDRLGGDRHVFGVR
jgi:hypothetical protein